MEKFSMLSYFKFRKNARNPGKKKYYTREGILLQFLKMCWKESSNLTL